MNDEESWQSWLDEHPDDHFARMAFADWLQDRDDPRAAGYRALGELKLKPFKDYGWPGGHTGGNHTDVDRYEWWNGEDAEENSGGHPECVLPWYRHLTGGYVYEGDDDTESTDYLSRREAEDAATLAYTKELTGAQV